MSDAVEQLLTLVEADQVDHIATHLELHSELKARLNEPLCAWNMPVLAAAKSRNVVDLLLRHGAELDAVSRWWGPGFWASKVSPDVGAYLVEKGAGISIHAAVAIGLHEIVEQMLQEDPGLCCAPGGDACHPLHFCTDIELAKILLRHGADINARDEDHHSTPIQWAIADNEPFVRFLLAEGAEFDIFMAAALGEQEMAEQALATDPQATEYRIGYNNGPFPGIGFEGRGGTIYQWTLGFNWTPHEVALKRGHPAIYELLLQRSSPKAQLLVACTSANRELAHSLIQEDPELVHSLGDEDHELLAKFCWETNIDRDAVELMLDIGFPIDRRERNHGAFALHNAAWCGDPDLVALLLQRGAPIDARDPDHNGTALGWALQSCLVEKRHPDGRFEEVVCLLLEAGVPLDREPPVGHKGIDRVIAGFRGE